MGRLFADWVDHSRTDSQQFSNHCIRDMGGNYAGGHFVELSNCIGQYVPFETVWY